jgi:hypothetical protein
LKIPSDYEPDMLEDLRRELWKDMGRNDVARRRRWREILKHEAEKRKRKAERKRQYGLKHRQDIKYEAFKHYSPDGIIKCANCGFDDIRALGIRSMKGPKNQDVHGGWNLYEWLKNSGWPEGYQVFCENCIFIQVGRGRWYSLKEQVFQHYSKKKIPECAQCGFKDIRALSLDHVEGGGRKQMKELGLTKASKWYEYLKVHDYPKRPKLQVFCMNCQFIKEYENPQWGEIGDSWPRAEPATKTATTEAPKQPTTKPLQQPMTKAPERTSHDFPYLDKRDIPENGRRIATIIRPPQIAETKWGKAYRFTVQFENV